jgi:hypothetical protein
MKKSVEIEMFDIKHINIDDNQGLHLTIKDTDYFLSRKVIKNIFNQYDLKVNSIYNIANAFDKAKQRDWDKIYIAIDLHGTVIQPDYEKTATLYYPYAKDCLQYLTNRKDVKLIMYTCSHKDEIDKYISMFNKDGIVFDYINENPDVKDTKMGDFGVKPYFNILFEDKAGFDPSNWKLILNEFIKQKYLEVSN